MNTIREKRSRKNPIETSNLFSILFFGWIAPIFWKGAKRDLHLEDLYGPLSSHESERLGDHLEREWKKELMEANEAAITEKDEKKESARQPNLMWAIARIFWGPYMLQGLLLFFQATVLELMQPILQGLIISYFDPSEELITKNTVLLYAGSLVIVRIFLSGILHHTILHSREIGMCIRVACCSLIYRKILCLNQAAVNNTAAGQVTNLISNDVARFDEVLIYLHYIWIVPVQVLMVGYVMWRSVGVAALVGMGTVIIQTTPIQGYMSSLGAKLRARIAAKTDERVQLMTQLLSGMQVVKMYSWEKPFDEMISKVRGIEMKFIAYASYLRGLDLSFVTFSPSVSLYFTLITFVLMGNDLTAETTFTLVGLFAALQDSCNFCFPQAIILAGEASVSLERITNFLLLDEVDFSKEIEYSANAGMRSSEEVKIVQEIEPQAGIEMIKVTANWIRDQAPPTLSEVSIKIQRRDLCVLVGSVGSGKSSLLHLVLGELPVQTGNLSLSTGKTSKTRMTSRDINISYASQDPWLFAATIRDNILFGQPYDETRYRDVTRVCALLRDFEQLPQGDLTFVGERGAALSGGQRARVNLARAVYRDAEVYLLDDPLSAVDARVARHLFEECITGFLKDKTRILVTHQLQHLQRADSIVVLDKGIVEYHGSYEELVKTDFNISKFGEPRKPDGVEHIEESDKENPERKTTGKASDEINKLPEATECSEGLRDVSEEEMATGNISSRVYLDYFLAGGSACSLALLAAVTVAAQVAVAGTDYWITVWSNQEALKATLRSNDSIAENTSQQSDAKNDRRSMYSTDSQWFDEHGLWRRNLGIYVYTICLIAAIVLITLGNMLFTKMCMNASRNLHNSIYANLLHAPMRFFHANPTGRILNRFTKDVGTMDELLPMVMLEAIHVFAYSIGIFTLIIIANNWMILPTVVVCVCFYIVRCCYLKTAQNIKRLESIAKSPMFSHVTSTLDGLTTIRSRGPPAEGLLRREFDRHQDTHSGAWYLSITTDAAIGLTVDLVCSGFVTCICFSFILMNAEGTLGGFVGLAISQSLSLTIMVHYGVKQTVKLISQMTSVERILQYTKLPKEESRTTLNPPSPTWPSKGELVFKDVSMKYVDDEPPVLKNLNVTISSGWKVGIVGRTGAGKSSLIAALFRLTGDGLEGEIVLDGVDTKSIALHELRPRISIIPQVPILFSASLRHNLDPCQNYSDADLWASLREVELGDVVPSLDFQVAEGGANFSVGQRQLICLARAILRNNRLLVLDEATANVDPTTDALIQNTIRRRFADCTVLTIAHRLNTIMDGDRVLVMRDGSIVEFGHPHLLLQNRDGHFSQMVRQTGHSTAKELAEIAGRAFLHSPEFDEIRNETSSASMIEQITRL